MNVTAKRLPTYVSLERWAEIHYGEDAPTPATLRAWARQGKILPPPVKHGRSYRVSPEARYVDPKAVERNPLLGAVYAAS